MMHTVANLSLTLVLLVGIALAASTTDTTGATNEVDRNTNVAPAQSTNQNTNSELSSLPGNLLSMLANGGTLVAGMLALVAVAMLVMPLFGFRMCSILGGCDTFQGYTYNNDAYNTGSYGQTPLYTQPGYQKRSLEYVGPILKALSSAYDKYGKMNAAPASTTVNKL